MRRQAKFAAATLCLVLLSGCAANTAPALIDLAALCRDWQVVKVNKGDKISDSTSKTILDNNDTRHKVYHCKKHENEAAS